MNLRTLCLVSLSSLSLLAPSLSLAQTTPPPGPEEATSPPAPSPDQSSPETSAPTVIETSDTEPAPSAADSPHPAEPELPEPAVSTVAAPPPPEATLPQDPPAPSLLPLQVGTSTWSRLEVRENYDKLGVSRGRFAEGDQTVFRARLKIETNPLELVDGVTGLVNFTPQASGLWGTSGGGGTIGEANLGIYEGFFLLKARTFDLKAGRFSMNYGDSLIIGNLDWHQSGRAFDGAHAHVPLTKGFIDFFGTQVAEGWPATNNPLFAGDTYFWGAYSALGGYLVDGLNLEPYFLGLSTASTANATGALPDGTAVTYQRDGATLMTAGFRLQHKLSIFDYRLEAGLQFGETAGGPTQDGIAEATSTLAYQIDGEFGVSLGKRARIGLGGFYASGDDPTTTQNEAYNELFPTTHKFLGWMDVIGFRTNITGGMLKLSASLTDSLSADLHGHLFARPQAGGLGRTGADSFAGGEINAQLTQKIGKYVAVRGLYGIFLANAAHYPSGDPAHYLELQGGLTF